MAYKFPKIRSRAALWLKSLTRTLFPRYCCVCQRRLMCGEEVICATCAGKLPLTNLKGRKGNCVERMLWNEVLCTERVNSFLFYKLKSPFSNIYFLFKYQNRPDVAVAFGMMMARDLTDTDFFETIDVMVPVPLSARRFRKRGYNQSERLAFGVRRVTQIPVDTDSVIRTVDNPTQTQLADEERRENVKDIFRLVHPERLHGKHVLLVDDMITTGSTVRSLARTVLEAGEVRISVLSLGTSNRNRQNVFPHFRRP